MSTSLGPDFLVILSHSQSSSSSFRVSRARCVLLMVVHSEAGEAGDVAVKEKNLKFEIVLSSFQTPNHMTYVIVFFFALTNCLQLDTVYETGNKNEATTTRTTSYSIWNDRQG